MPLPLSNNQPPSEGHPPLRPAVVDWVEEQSLHDEPSSGTTALKRARVDSLAPHAEQTKQARARTDENASGQEGRQRAKRVYDIATLLKLKETESTIPVMLRVKPEAIKGESVTLKLSCHQMG